MCFCSCICTESLHSSLVNSYISRWVNQSFGHADVIELTCEICFKSHPHANIEMASCGTYNSECSAKNIKKI
ncbi:uncharacterized protein DS421_3g89660 [Arachis hypogaea]|nr:uncharacterized protein DS421_3g89660 [Arachis hypogaea]